MADNGASIKIGSDTTQYEKGVKKVKDGFTDMNKSASSFSKIASGAISSFVGNLASTAVTKGFSVISNGFKSAISSVKEFTALSKIQEDALNDLDNSLVRTGQFSRATSKDIQAFASELQNNSRFGDEAILKNAALIQSLGSLSKDGLKQATQAAADLSAGIGKISFEQASEFIGKAALGNIGPLRELGIVVESTGDKAKDFQTALSLINDRFSGAAAGQIQNFTGVTQQLDNTIGDLKEKFGDLITQNPAIVTALQKVQQLFSELGSFVEDNKDELKALATEGFLLVVNGAFGLVGAVIEITSAFDRARTAYRAFLNAGSISRLEEELANLPAQIDAFGNRVETFYEGALKSQIERLKGESESERQSYEERLKLFESFTQKINEGQDAINSGARSVLGRDLEAEREAASERNRIRIEADELEKQRQLTAFEEDRALRLGYIQSILGEEEALITSARAGELAALGNLKAAKDAISAAEVKARKADIFAIQKFEALSQAERLANVKSTLGTISSLQSSSNKELFAIGKAAAIATATIDGITAVQKALSSAPPPFNFAIAAIVGAATVANVSKIASSKPPTGAFDGALVESGSIFKDTEPFMLSKGEVVAPRKDFDDVVEGTARQRGFVKRNESQSTTDSTALVRLIEKMDALINTLSDQTQSVVEIRATDDFIEFIDEQLQKRRALGISISGVV
jgi:hypothetical protein